MVLYFFTAADKNPVYRREAEFLIKSGDKFGRKIHFYDIPDGEMWNRYKVKLIASDLPKADKYIYLDSDCILTGPGDWENDECAGVADVLYYIDHEPLRHQHTNAFMRNHTVTIGEGQGYDFVVKLWRQMELPIWCNSGVTVLPADVRPAFCKCWAAWMDTIDRHCQNGYMVGDEAPLMFARHLFGLPFLPPRFNNMLKWQPVREDAVLLHADGNVSGEKRQPYLDAIKSLEA